MNATDVLKYGHLHLMKTLDGLPDSVWEISGVCGVWSVRDILAHLASFEHVLVEILDGIVHQIRQETPFLTRMLEDYDGFNDKEVALMADKSVSEILADYTATCEKTLALAVQIPAETWRTNGILAWYGEDYDLDDFIAYTFYGHKREHGAQIAVFKDNLKTQTTK